MLNIKNILIKILNFLTLNSGATLTGELKRSDGAVAIGSGLASSNTIGDLIQELRYSSGAIGSVNITTAYTASGVTIAAAWYNYCYIPHRSGGSNGIDIPGNDNCNYGNLILCGMTNGPVYYDIRISGGALTAIYQWDTSEPTTGTITSTSTTNYSIYTTYTRYTKFGRLVVLEIYLRPTSAVKWSSVFASGAPAPYGGRVVYGAACCETDGDSASSVAISVNSSGQIAAAGGVNSKYYYGVLYYIANS